MALQPIVLLGAARSGTKFVRDLLAASPEVAAIPYDVNYIWRHGNEGCPHDALTPDMLDTRQVGHIRRELERLARRQAGPGSRFFIEKTVSNSLRPDVVRQVLPDARFLYLERDGRDVIESAIRQWRAPLERGYLLHKLRYFPVREWRYALWFAKNTLQPGNGPAIWGPRYDGIRVDLDERSVPYVCARQWVAGVRGWRDHADREAVELRYESLFDEASPLYELVSSLGIEDADPILDHFDRHARPRMGSWPGSLLPQEVADVEEVLERHEASGRTP